MPAASRHFVCAEAQQVGWPEVYGGGWGEGIEATRVPFLHSFECKRGCWRAVREWKMRFQFQKGTDLEG
jgi:hypothetical protein